MDSLVIGIAGGTGSGKTTVTNAILKRLDTTRVVVIQHDSYYRDLSAHGGATPDQINFDHPDSLETPLLIRHIKDLKAGLSIEQPIYNFTTHRRLDSTRRLEPREDHHHRRHLHFRGQGIAGIHGRPRSLWIRMLTSG